MHGKETKGDEFGLGGIFLCKDGFVVDDNDSDRFIHGEQPCCGCPGQWISRKDTTINKMTQEYPKSHPHSEELRELRIRADALYRKIKASEDGAREAYKAAMENLVDMGRMRMESHEALAELAKIMGEIEALAAKPFF